MKMRNTFGCTLTALLATMMFSVQPASAKLVVQDRLTDSDRTDSEDFEAAFLSVGGSTTTTTVADDTGGLDDGDAVDVAPATFRGVAGIFDTDATGGFDSVTPLLGENLEMRFTFRLTARNEVDNSVFRFGVLNNGGDQQTADNEVDTNDTNTTGFGVELGITGGSGRFIEDTNTGGGENSMLGGAGLIASSGLGLPAITDLTPHEAVFRLTRTATGYDAAIELDGTNTATGSFTTALDVFHQLGWISGDSVNDFRLDHVELDRNILRNGTFERGARIASGDAEGAFDDFDRHWTNNNSVASVHQGLAGESATAAFLSATTGDDLGQSVSTDADFMFDVDFAAEAGGGSRSFNMQLKNKGDGQINLRVNNSDGSISVFDGTPGSGGAWQLISGLGNITFSDDADGDSDFTSIGDTLNGWHLTVVGHDYGTINANYDLILFPLLDPNDVRTVTGLTLWQDAAPTTAAQDGLDTALFTTMFSSTDFAIDNVSLVNTTVIPEPSTFTLIALAAMGLLRRRV